MTERSSIAVIRARLPYIAPEALSQAWLSALCIARDGTAAPPARARGAIALAPAVPHLPGPAQPRNAAQPTAIQAIAVPSRAARAAEAQPAAATASPRSVRRLGLQQRYRPPLPEAQTSFTVDVEGARVAFVVRCGSGRIGVIALCVPRHAQLVQRALAHVAYGLRAAGTRLDAAVREVRSA